MLPPADDAHRDRLDQGEREEEIRAFLGISCVAGSRHQLPCDLFGTGARSGTRWSPDSSMPHAGSSIHVFRKGLRVRAGALSVMVGEAQTEAAQRMRWLYCGACCSLR
jgi:hypothetical protein